MSGDVDQQPAGTRLGLTSAAFLLGLMWWQKRKQPRDRPEIVVLNPVSEALLTRAKEMASHGREDRNAVDELRTLAAGKRRALRQAERASRFGGFHHELRFANLVNRLLRGACVGGSPPPVDPEDVVRIEAIESFEALAPDEQWARLVALEPRLAVIAADVRAGRLGPRRSQRPTSERATESSESPPELDVHALDPGLRNQSPQRTDFGPDGRIMRRVAVRSRASRSEEEDRELTAWAEESLALHRRLKVLVGPGASSADLVLGSARALQCASAYLDPPAAPISRGQ